MKRQDNAISAVAVDALLNAEAVMLYSAQQQVAAEYDEQLAGDRGITNFGTVYRRRALPCIVSSLPPIVYSSYLDLHALAPVVRPQLTGIRLYNKGRMPCT